MTTPKKPKLEAISGHSYYPPQSASNWFLLLKSFPGAVRYALFMCLVSRPRFLRMLRMIYAIPRELPSWMARRAYLNIGSLVQPLRNVDTKKVLASEEYNTADSIAPRLPAGGIIMGIKWKEEHKAQKAKLAKSLNRPYGRLENIVVTRAREYLDAGKGEINAGHGYAENVTLDVACDYFGLYDPAAHDREEIRRLLRLVGSEIFTSPPKGSVIEGKILAGKNSLLKIALESADTIIALVAQDETPATHEKLNTVLAALIKQSGTMKIDATERRIWAARNLVTLCVFGVGTVSRATTQIIYRLMTEPGASKIAHQAVEDLLSDPTSENRQKVHLVAMEALRFNPMLPLLGPRRVLRGTVIKSERPERDLEVHVGQSVLPSPLAAMFDKDAFPSPKKFQLEGREEDNYLHFGHGQHKCVGMEDGLVQIERMIIELFSRSPVKPKYRKSKIVYDGVAADTYWVTYGGSSDNA